MASPRRLIPLVVAAWCLAVPVAVGAAQGRVAALESLRVEEKVEGDVVVLGGDVVLGREAHVEGHVVAVFGTVRLEEGARVDGRVVAVRSLARLTVDPRLEHQLPWLSLGLRLLTSGLWLLAATLLAWVGPRWMRSGVAMLEGRSFRMLVLGGLATLTVFAAMVAVVGLGPTLGLPLSVALLVVFLVAKGIGLAVIGGTVSTRLRRSLVPRSLPLSVDVLAGTAVILALRFLPVVGGALWSVVSVAAFGVGIMALIIAGEQGAVVLRTRTS